MHVGILAPCSEFLGCGAKVPFWDGATHFVGFVLGSYTFWAAICFRAVISLSFATSKRRHFCFDYLISLSIHVLFCFMSVLGNMIAREARVPGVAIVG